MFGIAMSKTANKELFGIQCSTSNVDFIVKSNYGI